MAFNDLFLAEITKDVLGKCVIYYSMEEEIMVKKRKVDIKDKMQKLFC